MAMENPDNFYLEETVVVTVYNTKIPDLMGIMEGVRASDLDRFDSDLLRLEENIIRAAHHLKSYCRRLIQELTFRVARGTFDMLWHRLSYDFQQFCEHCFQLGINVPNPRCLVLTDDEASGDEDDQFYQL